MNLMPLIARCHPKNWDKRHHEYPQLWYCMPRRWKRDKEGNILRRAIPRLILEKLCGWLTGHELSKSEWGYGGGKFVDHHCRWCDKVIKVPKVESPPPGILGDIVDEME